MKLLVLISFKVLDLFFIKGIITISFKTNYFLGGILMEEKKCGNLETEPLIFRVKIASKAIKNRLNSISKNIGAFDSYRPFIFALAYQEGLTQTQLVSFSRLSKPTVSLTLQQMEKDELIVFKSDELDRRKTLVFLTDKGKALNAEMRTGFDNLNQDIVRLYSDKELLDFEEYLNRMIKYLLEGVNAND